MQFVPLICPQCSASLQLPDDAQSAKCKYCGTDVFVGQSNDEVTDTQVAKLLALAGAAHEAGNHGEAYEYFTKTLEIESTNVRAWVGKGTSAGYLSTLAHSRIQEAISHYRNALKFAESDEAVRTVASMDIAVAAVLIADAYFDTSLQHTMRFIAVADTPYEHATRCVEAVMLCDFALSVDADAVGAATFIRDVAARTLKVGKLTEEERSYLKLQLEKHSQQALSPKPEEHSPSPTPRPASTSAQSSSFAWLVYAVMGAAYVAGFFMAKEMGVETTFWALIAALFLSIPIGGAVMVLGMLAAVKLKAASRK